MPIIKPEDLDVISRKLKRTINLRRGVSRARIVVHMETCGIAAGARSVMKALIDEVEHQELNDVLITISGCAGLCEHEPMITVDIQDELPVRYVDLNPDKALDILNTHVLGGSVLSEYALTSDRENMLSGD